MRNYLVVVADAARARFFELIPVEFPELESGPNLVEIEDLVNPEIEEKGRDLWSDLKTGRGKAPGEGAAHGYDDHRERHRDEIERRFAHLTGAETINRVNRQKVDVLIVTAESRMLGMLRDAIGKKLPAETRLTERAEDLSKLDVLELHTHLAKEGLLPPRKPPQG